ncbi:tRNA nuclease WapA precursor [Candidatus Izimaplasma bacterium HR1]|nr:tRNA nuclease WapA precursor [Candidatus Izimaplasma bacterium HR1]
MYYLNSRFYNPDIGRFINSDGLLGEAGNILGHNMYAYCQNNPVMYTDPSGEFFGVIAVIAVCVSIVGAISLGTAIGNTFKLMKSSRMLKSTSKINYDDYDLSNDEVLKMKLDQDARFAAIDNVSLTTNIMNGLRLTLRSIAKLARVDGAFSDSWGVEQVSIIDIDYELDGIINSYTSEADSFNPENVEYYKNRFDYWRKYYADLH